MTFGLPGLPNIVNDIVAPAVENAVKLAGAAARVFSDEPAVDTQTPLQRTNAALFGPGGSAAMPPPAPAPPADGAGGLNDGAEAAGDEYNSSVDGAALTDDKLATLLKQIFESNQQARERVNAIITEIQSKSTQIAPEMGDPASVVAFQQFLDQKFAEMQKLLDDAQVDSKTQAAIMDALGEEYQANGPGTTGDGQASSSGGGGAGGASDPGGASAAGVAPGVLPEAGGGADASEGLDPLADPLAGLGPMGMGGMDPLSSLAGMGATLPGMLGGLGAGSPLGGLGSALGGLGSTLPGLASQFSDKGSRDGQVEAAEFSDATAPTQGDSQKAEFTDEQAPAGDEAAGPADDSTTTGDPADSPADPVSADTEAETPDSAAPATASGGDPQRTVRLPDGTSVEAPDAQRAAAVKSVMNGESVSAAYGDNIPPPGTPVMEPVDRNSLQPGDFAQFAAKPAVMYVGNGNVWLDGQLKPVSTLPSSEDFLGWTSPPATGAVMQAAATAPAAPPATPAPVPVAPGAPESGSPVA